MELATRQHSANKTIAVLILESCLISGFEQIAGRLQQLRIFDLLVRVLYYTASQDERGLRVEFDFFAYLVFPDALTAA
jgi:hypothetical protein